MRDVMDQLEGWWKNGQSAALATVVGTFRSAPRQPGASMLVGPEGEAVGSVSGGCVEGAVYELGEQVLRDDRPVLQRYGVSDDDAFAVGLTCGGILDVFVERVDQDSYPQLGAVADALRDGSPVAVATVVSGPSERLGKRLVVWPNRVDGGTGSDRLDAAIRDDARGLLDSGRNGTMTYGVDGQRRGEGLSVFVESFAPPPRMIVFGAIDFAAAVAKIGNFLGFRVTVCDARPVFATASRFPGANEVVVEWPHRYLAAEAEAGRIDQRTVLCVLTHDPKFDVPLLEVALRLPEVAYIGAMGSRRTHEDRLERLRERGLTEDEIARMSSPIGLDLGARTPEETAVSIAAEMIAQHWGGGGRRLAEREGPIHAERRVGLSGRWRSRRAFAPAHRRRAWSGAATMWCRRASWSSVGEAHRAGDSVLLTRRGSADRGRAETDDVEQPPMGLSKFHAPEIVFGDDSLPEAAHAALRLGARRPFVVTDPGLTEAGWPAELLGPAARGRAGPPGVDRRHTEPEGPRDRGRPPALPGGRLRRGARASAAAR